MKNSISTLDADPFQTIKELPFDIPNFIQQPKFNKDDGATTESITISVQNSIIP